MDKLETKRLLLRKLTMQDASDIEKYAGDYDVAKTTLSIPHPYPKGSGISFIQSTERAEQMGKVILFAIEEKHSGQFIGVMNFNLSKEHQRAELAYWIGKPFWGKGYGTEAAQKLIGYGFEKLDLNKIHAAAFASNPGSWRIMEKVGMKREGLLQQHLVRFHEVHDVVYYGILKEDYIGGSRND